jgi:hypothetical protein
MSKKVLVDEIPSYLKELLEVFNKFNIQYSTDNVLKYIRVKVKIKEIYWHPFTILELSQGPKIIRLKVMWDKIEVHVVDVDRDISEVVLMPNDYQVKYLNGYLYINYRYFVLMKDMEVIDQYELK